MKTRAALGLTPRECGRHLEELMTAYDLTRITAARERRDLQAALDREAATD